MRAIIESGGKQLLVANDDVIYIEKIAGEVNETVIFDKVLLVDKKIGRPYLKGAKVSAVIEKQGRQKKIIVYRHNPKSTHKRKLGHRQPYTRVRITSITI